MHPLPCIPMLYASKYIGIYIYITVWLEHRSYLLFDEIPFAWVCNMSIHIPNSLVQLLTEDDVIETNDFSFSFFFSCVGGVPILEFNSLGNALVRYVNMGGVNWLLITKITIFWKFNCYTNNF